MSLTEKISLGIQVLTLVAATYIGMIQTQINVRQASLSDYVAISATPDPSGTRLTLLNTGKTNLYLNKIDVGGTVTNYDRPRLLPTGTLESSYYWITPPQDLPIDKEFDMKIYVTDEFGTKWVSEHGGRVFERTGLVDGEKVTDRVYGLWSYKIEKEKN